MGKKKKMIEMKKRMGKKADKEERTGKRIGKKKGMEKTKRTGKKKRMEMKKRTGKRTGNRIKPPQSREIRKVGRENIRGSNRAGRDLKDGE
jgi:hypothetical protein